MNSLRRTAPVRSLRQLWRGHPVLAWWLAVLTLLVAGGWIAGGLVIFGFGNLLGLRSRGAAIEPPDDATDSAESPWGQLVYVPITIAPPLEFVPEVLPAPGDVVWSFPQVDAAGLPKLLGAIELSEPLQQALLKLAAFDAAVEGMAVRPPRELVLGLQPDDRMKLYVTLGNNPQNLDQANAFRYYSDSIDEWLGCMPLTEQTRQLVRPLIYRHGGYLFFADLRSIEGQLSSPKERRLLVKCLSHEKTFLVKLRVPPGADIERLVAYWSRGGRAKDIRPILDSLNDLQHGGEIDVIHLLPRFARSRIFTYPPPPERLPALNRDCHWTSLNFFNLEPDDRFCVDTEAMRAIEQDYERIFGNYQLGDLVLLVRGDEIVHSAIYIADDFVFTKNGNISSRPWMFLTLASMQHYYPAIKPLEPRVYRRKGI